jgi:hypothetical protein
MMGVRSLAFDGPFVQQVSSTFDGSTASRARPSRVRCGA